MHPTTIAVDLAKSVFEVAVSQRPGKVAERRRLSRAQFARFLREREPTTLVMEACGTAHYWGREAQAQGHEVVLLPPHAVRPYVLRNKTDGADAKGLLEAQRNEAIRPVPVKSEAQQVLTALHRLRSTWMAARTARLNTLRGLLRELGFFIPVGARQVSPDPPSVPPTAAPPEATPHPHVLAVATEGTWPGATLDGHPFRAVTIGDADFASNSFLPYLANSDLALSMVRWLVREDRSPAVASRITVPPLILLTRAQMRQIFLVTEVLLPLGTLMIGAFVWWKRR